MKKIISIIMLACIFCNFVNAQSRKGHITNNTSIEDCKKYFKDNMLDLDPIEGVYDLRLIQQGKNSFVTFPPTEEKTKIAIYKTKSGKYSITPFSKVSIERIGETNAYNWITNWSDVYVVDNVRFLLNNELHFNVKTDVPAAQIKKDQGRNYQSGMRVTFTFNGIKEYPTRTMYIEAAAEEAKRIVEEQNRRQEEIAKEAGWTGTGFALKDGYIVTNHHVIEDATNITIQGVKGDFANKLTAQVVASDKYNDIAILKINDSRFTGFGAIPYLVKANISDVAEEIFVLGYPMTSTMGDEIKYTTGVISSKTGFQGDVSQYQISAPVQPGNSGGPLFDSKGNVIGIVSAKHTGAENVGYAIKASYLKNLIESVLSTNIIPITNTGIQALSNAEKVRKIKPFVFLINANIETTKSTSNHYISSTPSFASSSSTSDLKSDNVSLSPDKLNLRIGESRQLNIYPSTAIGNIRKWESDNTNIVTVNNRGHITAINKGVVSVWAFFNQGFAKRCFVIVE